MNDWAFFDGNGDEITRGWQGYEHQAREMAQRFANDRGIVVEACIEGSWTDDDGEPLDPMPPPQIVCEPEEL